MTAVAEKPEMITLPTLYSDDRSQEVLLRHLIKSGVTVSYQERQDIMDLSSDVNNSITSGVAYTPVIIPATYFVNQNIGFCESNQWFIPEDHIRKVASGAGLKPPPVELAHLISCNLSPRGLEADNLRSLIVMSSTEEQKMIGCSDPDRIFLMSAWKNTFKGVRHIHAWNSGFLFIRPQ